MPFTRDEVNELLRAIRASQEALAVPIITSPSTFDFINSQEPLPVSIISPSGPPTTLTSEDPSEEIECPSQVEPSYSIGG